MELSLLKKLMNIVSPVISISCLAATSYLLLKDKKNMLDVIIEEVESMK